MIYTDIDFPYLFDDLTGILEQLECGSDIVAGSRSDEYYTNIPRRRVFVSRMARFFLQYFLRLKLTDTQCGLKGLSKKAKPVFLQTRINRFLFDMEFIFRAGKHDELVLISHPVTLREGVRFSEFSLLFLIKEGLNSIRIFLSK